MKSNFIISAIIHILAIVAVLFVNLRASDDDIPPDRRLAPIEVDVVSWSDIAPQSAPPEEVIEETSQPNIPEAVESDEPDIPISDPTTKPEVEIDKPDPEPEPEVESPPEEVTQTPDETTQQPTTSQPQEQPDEQPTGHDIEGQSGTGIAGATVNNAMFGQKYPFWFTQAYRKLSSNFNVPVMIDGRVQCQIYFEVIKSGRVINVDMIKSSGVPQFDQASLQAVESSSPLPPLPNKFLDEIIGLTVTFENSY